MRRRLVLHFGEHGSLDLPAAAGDRTTARVAALDDGFLRANRSAHPPTQGAGIADAPAPTYDDDALIDFFVQGHMGALLGADGAEVCSSRTRAPGLPLTAPPPAPPTARRCRPGASPARGRRH